MVKLFAEIKLKKENSKMAVFDIEEAISYFDEVFEVRYFEELPSSEHHNHFLGESQVKNMKIFNRKMLLDEFVDYLATPPNPEMSLESEV
jgi:hypothetical protein